MEPTREQALWMYEKIVLSRRYEEALEKLYMEGKQPLFNMANGPLPGEMHLSNGQEPCAVGVCAHLGSEDFVTAPHRAHHVAIAKGVDLKAMTAEILGKKQGLSGGRGGHMHLFDARVNFCNSGIIAQGMGPAVGAALARKMRGEAGISVAFVGEGAVNQGAFHETMNLAAIWKVPFICVIEDNAWGVSVHKSESTSVPTNDVRAAAYGIPGVHVPGNDVFAIFSAFGEAAARARAGEGPTLIEIETWRLAGHFMGDVEGYRPEGEKEGLFARDPILVTRTQLLERGYADEASLEALEAAQAELVEELVAYARGCDDAPPQDALTAVFA